MRDVGSMYGSTVGAMKGENDVARTDPYRGCNIYT